ncbi:MAG: UbiX family flavin prenyltransferase [Rhodospirillales bacterium]|nr:UbiX family flavin prenyltransferase [Rhodospirillales bacterium]
MTAPILVGISGASGAIYGIEILKRLKQFGQPAHLVLSEWGAETIGLETDINADEVRALADAVYDNANLAAAVSSGSFLTRGMVIAPCSVKTLSGIANSFTYNLLIRAADVTLKEKRPLILVFRETPLHAGHLDMLSRVAGLGATVLPPMPAFYSRPETIADIVDQTVGKVLDQFGIEHDVSRRWSGQES